jgi:hypothetical protein
MYTKPRPFHNKNSRFGIRTKTDSTKVYIKAFTRFSFFHLAEDVGFRHYSTPVPTESDLIHWSDWISWAYVYHYTEKKKVSHETIFETKSKPF